MYVCAYVSERGKGAGLFVACEQKKSTLFLPVLHLALPAHNAAYVCVFVRGV